MKHARASRGVSWYGAKTVYLHSEGSARGCFEERVVMLQATGFAGALKAAEAEARRYAKNVGGCDYLGYVDVYLIAEKARPGRGTEVYSLMRASRLKPKKYLDSFYDTGRERAGR